VSPFCEDGSEVADEDLPDNVSLSEVEELPKAPRRLAKNDSIMSVDSDGLPIFLKQLEKEPAQVPAHEPTVLYVPMGSGYEPVPPTKADLKNKRDCVHKRPAAGPKSKALKRPACHADEVVGVVLLGCSKCRFSVRGCATCKARVAKAAAAAMNVD
jgi:hypothetical protein